MYARQVVLNQPIIWIHLNPYPLAIIGDATWTNLTLSAKIRFPSVNASDSAFLAVRVRHTQCVTAEATGIFLWLNVGFRSYVISSDIGALKILDTGLFDGSIIGKNEWYNVSISVHNSNFTASINGVEISSLVLPKDAPKAGFAAMGTGGWGYADFDDLRIEKKLAEE